MGEAKFSRIFGTLVLVNFGTVIVECKNVLLSNEHVAVLSPSFLSMSKKPRHDRMGLPLKRRENSC